MTTHMRTIVSRICQNCFRDLSKETSQSNFCCQDCFDEWMGKQISNAIAEVSFGINNLMRMK